MSDFSTVAIMFAIGVFNMFFYWSANRWMHSQGDAIVTGLIRGVHVSTEYRRFLPNTSWLFAVVGGVGAELVTTIFWMVIASTLTVYELRMCAYLGAFLNFIAVVAWAVIAPFWYGQLASALRVAEAD